MEQYLTDTHDGATVIESTLSRAKSLVANFKQVAVDRQSAQRRRFSLYEIIEETAEPLRPSLKSQPYKLEIACEDDADMDSYPGPLGQVITNLVENALKHGLENQSEGSIRIAAEPLTEYVKLTIADDGNGIPENIQKRMFDPFFTTKMGQGGSGLGMSLVHRLVNEVMGGWITVHSVVGEGTTFTIALPYTAPASDPQTPAADVAAIPEAS